VMDAVATLVNSAYKKISSPDGDEKLVVPPKFKPKQESYL